LQKGLRPAVVRLFDELDTLINAFGHDDTGEPDPGHGLAQKPPIATGALPAMPPPHDTAERSVLGSVRDLVRGKGLRAAAMNSALGNSETMNKLFGAVERVARRGCRLIIGLEGARIRTEIEAALTFAELEAAGAHDRGEDPGWAWLRHRYAVSYRMSPVFRDGAFVDTMEVAASWDKLLDLYHSVREAISVHALVMAHLSHGYADGCSIYFTFVGTTPARDGAAAARRKYDAIWRDGLEATTRVGGTISHHHGVGLLKAPYMAGEHREAMAIFQAAKKSFDPDGIMNPGKMGLR
jgi:alkyldihydroxyacetonephosphate synthase